MPLSHRPIPWLFYTSGGSDNGYLRFTCTSTVVPVKSHVPESTDDAEIRLY
jgi:hypothetical protein